jgi:hypothetical protein
VGEELYVTRNAFWNKLLKVQRHKQAPQSRSYMAELIFFLLKKAQDN